ncbi:MAG: PD-(D/E)XK nuclease-like domain-containing protein [Chloroflexota bacterium]|nr:PD-(D/E)XK nuclease-like domain-containing protein [Chloroflexota bacterium]
MTFEEYLCLPGTNISTLLAMGKSPAHYRFVADGGQKRDTAALRLGRLAHCAILEPERFAAEVAVWTGGRRAGQAYTTWAAENEGRLQLKEDEHEQLMAMSSAVAAHPAAGRILSSVTPGLVLVEHTIQWTHKIGIACRSRLDWIDPEAGVVVDLKTAREATEFEFGRAAAQHQYHTRAAFYCDAYQAKFGSAPEYYLVAVEKEQPYAVAVYRVGEDALDVGRRSYEKLIGQLKGCLEADSWPGIANDEIAELQLPAWVFSGDDALDLVIDGEAHRV